MKHSNREIGKFYALSHRLIYHLLILRRQQTQDTKFLVIIHFTLMLWRINLNVPLPQPCLNFPQIIYFPQQKIIIIIIECDAQDVFKMLLSERSSDCRRQYVNSCWLFAPLLSAGFFLFPRRSRHEHSKHVEASKLFRTWREALNIHFSRATLRKTPLSLNKGYFFTVWRSSHHMEST